MQDIQRFGCYLQRKDGKIKSRQSFLLKIPQMRGSIYGLIFGSTGNDKKYERSGMRTLNGIYFLFSF
jgi:hypothetical protein